MHVSEKPDGFIPPHGGYKALKSYQKSLIVYDITCIFCDRFIPRRSRTHDQMVQAARSGKQNIVEGSKASGTSKHSEIKLMNVARASLEELLEDYRDFLRSEQVEAWDKDSNEARYVRKLGNAFSSFRPFVESRPGAVVANIALCVIHQTNYLLDRQLRSLEKEFLENGGLRERMTRARLAHRGR